MDDGGVKAPLPKRQMKTPFQLEMLEAAYAADAYPPESVRAELSVKLDLTDRQLQMWFCHRRLKDRNKAKPSEMNDSSIAEDGKAVVKSGKSKKRKLMSQLQGIELDPPVMRRHHDSPSLRRQSAVERHAISLVELQLGESLRVDGPVLGIEFDPLPPDAFGAALEETSSYPKNVGRYSSRESEFNNAQNYLPANDLISKSSGPKKMRLQGMSHSQNPSRDLREYDFFSQRPSIRDSLEPEASKSSSRLHRGSHQFSGHGRHSHTLSFGAADNEFSPNRKSFTCEGSDASASDEYQHEEEYFQMERKQRKSYEAQIHKKVEAREKLSTKEMEKQDILKRKLEERTQREMERHQREMRKEGERLMRERQREEERYQREQKREAERIEKFLQRENQRAEKIRLKEDERRQREEARQKAAIERASARRVAREAMELIDDERLELMELAAASENLPSFLSLDYETLQNLEAYKDFLPSFPPQAVQFKKPFTGKPWVDSDQNVGNLLMVWRFLMTFADILDLWPFTLDEFVQALHDYDPRLLSEIHISLLKSIIKDIEDAAKTPHGPVVNQSGVGGHLQVVEGAYAWGFDIRSWQCHLNPATWPEVLRQLALCAGFGPQLKKKQDDDVYLDGKNESPDGVDIVSILRNGAAAENAVALMRERGYSNNRRSRHRLTPGTVKFAVYHVLCFEGEKGLTILQVVDKVQKSGLRDLTTSKTPDASVGAALSRDTLLFERIAPCTYRVRAPYRKDLAEAPTILAAAREKLKIFENGHSDSEDEEKDPESPQDDGEAVSDSEYTEGLKSKGAVRVENLGKKMCKDVETIPDDGKEKLFGQCSSTFQASKGVRKAPDIVEDFQSTKEFGPAEIDENNIGEPWVQGLTEGEYSDLTVDERLNALVALVGVAIEGNSIRVVLEERLEAANCLKKQMWAEVQLDKRRMKDDSTSRAPYSSHLKNDADVIYGVTEGSAQSPLLRDKAIDNDIPLNPPTKQEFATDGMLDKDKVHAQQYGYVAAEKSRTELKSYLSHKAEDLYAYRSLPLGEDRRHNRYWQFVTSSKNDPGTGRIFFESQDGCWKLIDTAEVFDGLMESLDTRGVRESHLHSMLKRVEVTYKNTLKKKTNECVSAESVDVREGRTDSSPSDRTDESDSPLSNACGGNIDVVEKSVSFKTEIVGNEMERKAALKRYCDMQKWLWIECLSSSVLSAMKFGEKRCSELLSFCTFCNATYFCNDHHCACCHQTFAGSDINHSFPEHVLYCEEKKQKSTGLVTSLCDNLVRPARIELLKAQLAFIEASIPAEALQSQWTNDCRKVWGSMLHASVSAETIFQLFTQLEFAINPEYLSKYYETTKEHLGITSQCFGVGYNDAAPVLPWIPITTAAVGLRLMEFDASMCYMPQEKTNLDRDEEAGQFNKKYPARYALGKSANDTCMAEAPGSSGYAHPDTLEDCNKRRRSGPNVSENRNKRRRSGPDVPENLNKRSRSGSSRGRGGRRRGQGKSAYNGGGAASGRVLLTSTYKKRTQGPRRSIGSSRGGASTRGLRTAGNRQTRFVAEAVDEEVVPSYLQKADATFHIELQDSPQSSDAGEDWVDERTYDMSVDHKNDQLSGDEEYADEDDDQGAQDFTVSYRTKGDVSVSDSEDDGDEDEDEDDEDEDDGLGYGKPHHGREDEDGDKNEDVDEGIDGDESEEEENSDEESGSSSSSEGSDQ